MRIRTEAISLGTVPVEDLTLIPEEDVKLLSDTGLSHRKERIIVSSDASRRTGIAEGGCPRR